MRKSVIHGSYAILFGSFVLGCSAGAGAVGGTGEDTTSGESSSSTGSAQGAGGAGAASTGTFIDPSTGGNVVSTCMAGPEDDFDMDGFTITAGDCNDCDANANPGAIEVGPDDAMGMGGYQAADEDCDGEVDNVAPPCDASLALEGTDAMDGARAIELCKVSADGSWGVVSGQWVRANGSASSASLHNGILDGFGANVPPRAGGRVLAISSGTARDASDAGYVNHSYQGVGAGVAPPGFPQDVPNCTGATDIHDDVGLDLSIKAPTNATGYTFDFKFYSNEFPEFVCTDFNDQFIALVNPAPMGAINGNISFDSMNNPVSVNIAFFDVCQVNPAYPQFTCPLGTGELQGTGFANAEGGTGWLQTSAPIEGGATFSLRFAIWDTGDQSWDSTTIIDNFKWIANGGTVDVGTIDVPE